MTELRISARNNNRIPTSQDHNNSQRGLDLSGAEAEDWIKRTTLVADVARVEKASDPKLRLLDRNKADYPWINSP